MRKGGHETSASRWLEASAITVDSASRVPLATQISRQITWQVATGRVPADSFLPAMSDLAAHLGVNVHTVRAAYRQLAEDGIASMGRGMRTRILGYDRRRAVGGNDAHASFTIGVMVPEFIIYYNEYLEALTRAAEFEGWLPIFCRTEQFSADVVSRYMDQLFSRNVDGIILINFEKLGDDEVVDTLVSSAAIRPFVLVDSVDIGVGSRLVIDNAAGAYQATTHLIEHGHSRIGQLGMPADWRSAVPFRSGYEQALADAGLPVDGRIVVPVGDFTPDAGAKAAMQLLQQDEPVTAITCGGDAVAFGAITAAGELGLRVPEDLAIIGYGGNSLTRLGTTPVATIQIPADRLAHEAVRTLRQAIDTGEPQPPLTIPTKLVARESCGCRSR